MSIHTHVRCRASNAGLSLIEVAVAMIVIGLLIAPMIASFNQLVTDRKRIDTTSNQSVIATALQNFYAANNRLPCPATITKNELNTDYGQEDCGGTIVPTDTDILVGGVPFAALSIPVDATLDGWKNKISYTVAKADTASPLDTTLEKIVINGITYDASGNPVATSTAGQPNPPIYMLVSFGDDGLGAYTASGVSVGACPAASVRESANCDNEGTFFDDGINSQASSGRSLAKGNNYLDDIILTRSLLGDFWAYVPGQQNNIYSNYYVGIGTAAPIMPLDINGAAEIDNNLVIADSTTSGAQTLDVNQTPTGYCSASAAGKNTKTGLSQYSYNCFSANIIAGGAGTPPAPGGMGAGISSDCSAQAAMTGIANADAVCGQINYLSGHAGTCPTGKYVSGFDKTGKIVCN